LIFAIAQSAGRLLDLYDRCDHFTRLIFGYTPMSNVTPAFIGVSGVDFSIALVLLL
jgi:hypothetical protein